MGTNYYRVPVLTEERKKKLYKLIEEQKWSSSWDEMDDPESSVKSMVDSLDNGVHICKMSCGWQVNFDHNWGKYYQPNRNDLEKFLSEDGYIIKDEYGEEITPEDFWKKVEEHNLSSNNNWVSKTYEEYERSKNPNWITYPCYEDRSRVKETFGVDCDSEDFSIDGLRFAVFSDFS